MFTDYLMEKALDASVEIAKKMLAESGSRLLATASDIEHSIQHHLTSVKNWAREVYFSDVQKAKRTSDIFIELDLYLYPRRIRIDSTEVIATVPLKNIFDQDASHFVILGNPGAGKTTSMKYLCQRLFYDDTYHPERFSLPLLVKGRDLNSHEYTNGNSIIIDQIYNVLGLNIELPDQLARSKKKEDVRLRKSIREKLVINVLEQLSVVLIIDGFDEIAESSMREAALKDIRLLAAHLDTCCMIVTSRTGEFVYNIDNAVQYEIVPLTQDQILSFAQKWLRNEINAEDFYKKVLDSPFADTAIRPLTLAHLCAIYERVGKIPDKPKTIYKKIINLLLEEWDQQRSVKRHSKYAHFEIDRKFDFLCQLAFNLTTKLRKATFTHEDLTHIYTEIFHNFDLDLKEMQQVISEVESHTGLFIELGYRQYEFAHKSLQEYLTGEYLVKLPSIPNNNRTISLIPNELAVAVTVSSNQSEYFYELIVKRLNRFNLPVSFFQAFISRLLIEKPDFNFSAKTGLALSLLYSLYIEPYINASAEKTSQARTVKRAFENLIDTTMRYASLEVIRDFYSIVRAHRWDDGGEIYEMRKHKRPRGKLLPVPLLDLPETLYVSEVFLSK